ncbi:hypothetical protein CRG98_023043 [Punica granatum]|uniref:Uncharacterized protein n=1 Tax=Punica granatum TaxID=22663 RepID=A0A2I0JJU1_PUNGR|nr:hypothetical protein CRG98_023043 [Punica granatum]
MVEENPRAHEKLSEAVWVYRTSKRDLTGATPFSLTCGHDAVLPVEINVRSARIAYQHSLVHGNYLEAMLVKLDDLDIKRVRAHQHMQVQTRRVVRAYDKKWGRLVTPGYTWNRFLTHLDLFIVLPIRCRAYLARTAKTLFKGWIAAGNGGLAGDPQPQECGRRSTMKVSALPIIGAIGEACAFDIRDPWGISGNHKGKRKKKKNNISFF